jgi:hypothetical protein
MKMFPVAAALIGLSCSNASADARDDFIRLFEHGRAIVTPCQAAIHNIRMAGDCEFHALFGIPPRAGTPLSVQMGAHYQMLVFAVNAGLDTLPQGSQVQFDVEKVLRLKDRSQYCAYFAVDCAPLDADYRKNGWLYEKATAMEKSAAAHVVTKR